MVDQPPSIPADTGVRAGKRLPGMPWVIAVALVVAFLVLLNGTFRLGWTWTGFQDKDNATVWGWLKLVLLPVTVALLPVWLRSREQRKARWRVAFAVLGLVLAVLVVGGYRLHWAWTGFADNTLWNWLELFLVPFVLPVVIAWATSPPPAPSLDEQVAPEQAAQRPSASAGPVADVLPAPLVQDAARGLHARVVVDLVDLDAKDPGIRVAARYLPASLPSQAHSSSGAADDGPLSDTPPAQPPTDQPRRATGTESPDPPAQPPPMDPEPAVVAVAPAHSAPTRLVQAHPAMTIAATVVGIGLVVIGTLLALQARPPLASATGSSTPTAAPGRIVRTVMVSSRTQWVDTGIHLTEGQRVTITARGRVDHNRGSTDSVVGPDGDRNPTLRKYSILHSAPHAALLGMIAGTEGHPFLVGSYYHTNAIGQSGLLLLCVNDGGRTNNTGEFTAQIDVAMP